MMRCLGIISFAVAALALDGCSSLQAEVNRGHAELPGWQVPTAYTTADVRLITNRVHPVLGNEVLCAEPSPDIAKAVGAAFNLSATTPSNVGAKGGGGSAESLAELAGRSTALVGLRDALFRACEAYANGTIGQDSYGLIMSRYHSLMASLFLGQDIVSVAAGAPRTGSSAKAEAADADAIADTPPGGARPPPGGAPPGGKPGPAPGGPGAASAHPVEQVGVANDPSWQNAVLASVADSPLEDGPVRVADARAPAAASVEDKKPAVRAKPGGVAPQRQDGSTAGDKGGAAADTTATLVDAIAKLTDAVAKLDAKLAASNAQASGATNAQAVGALALTRINEDYADADLFGTLLVACINEYDPTRYRKGVGVNAFLEPICAGMMEASADPRNPYAEKSVLNTLRLLETSRSLTRNSDTSKVNPEAGVTGHSSASGKSANTQPAPRPKDPQPAPPPSAKGDKS